MFLLLFSDTDISVQNLFLDLEVSAFRPFEKKMIGMCNRLEQLLKGIRLQCNFALN